MIKNNIWNCIFHHKELEAQEDKYFECLSLVGFGPETLQFVNGANNLTQLLDAHKLAWNRGYRNSNLGPCEYGMFRTEDISKMLPEEVYLGNIWGLWTFNIPYWNEHSEVTMSGNGFGIDKTTTAYSLIMQQYRTLLRKNIENLIREAKDYCSKFDAIV